MTPNVSWARLLVYVFIAASIAAGGIYVIDTKRPHAMMAQAE